LLFGKSFDIFRNMETKDAVNMLSSLAQETRLSAFRLLVEAGEEGITAGVIAERLGVPAPTLSFHLSHLAHAGLVEAQRDGRQIRYMLRPDAFRALLAFLMDDCCGGRPELCEPLQRVCTGAACAAEESV
jgi:ArsR family transcriptional regulator, arsenate/arsenite/antimonite-responsive transcriptional repressor